ncbi:choice-of-anchor D domain-containing protein [Ktedonobacter sp. SOSP1-52]|uniref:choice-of-anchor D domain-containing protein n=1 Tax=Ktedonobacter sp. SOSP1-52 TaxID=2778366 RepID=UPI0027DC5489|nr:choice-of-anchor D domain-containing protein [Ktedonobacter sp. SOSP1-52]
MTANLLNNFISAAPPGVSLNPGSINFGNQNVNTASSSQSLTLINNGSSALTINSIGITGGSAGDFSQSNTCPISPSTLAAHASCTISVTYQPSVQGNSSATLTINDDASGSPHTAALTGAGVVPAPGSSLSPTSLDFGTQNLSIASGAKQITLTNNGTAALTINSIGISGTNASDYTQSNSCPASSSTLAPNASCTINVTFTPAGLGSRSATLTVNDSAAGSPYAIALTGTGVNSTIYFSDGFEGGNTSKWSLPNSDGSGSITVESSQVHSGTKAAAITNGSNQYAYLYAPLSSAQAHTYTRFYVRLASTTYGSIVAIGRNQNNGSIWEVDYDNVTHAFDIYFWGASNQVYSISTPNNSVNANTWYSLEIQDFQDQAGHAQVWLNGASQGSIDQNLSTGNPFQRIMMYSNAQTTLYFDDVQVASSYNGPTSGE